MFLLAPFRYVKERIEKKDNDLSGQGCSFGNKKNGRKGRQGTKLHS